MAAKKLTGGDGWSFEPAGGKSEPPARKSLPPENQKVKIRLEKRAKGKEITVVAGFVLSPGDRKELAALLRKNCGAGGSDTEEEITVQGDHRDKLAAYLTGLGWRAR